MTHDGISPEDAERLLVRPMEQELRGIEGIDEMTASAYEGGANVQLEFDAGVDTDVALQDVRAKVDIAKAELPAEAEEPTVNEVKFSRFDPMLVLNLAGPMYRNVPSTRLPATSRRKIEAIDGVLEVTSSRRARGIDGGHRRPVWRWRATASIKPRYSRWSTATTGSSPPAPCTRAKAAFPVKVPGVFETAEDILEMPIKAVGDRIVHFKDVASVRRTYKDAESYARLNGQPALGDRGRATQRRERDRHHRRGQGAGGRRASVYWPENIDSRCIERQVQTTSTRC